MSALINKVKDVIHSDKPDRSDRPSNAGPHKSNVMNKLDPRVDSDMDGSRNTGMKQAGYSTTGTTSGVGGGPMASSTNAGPYHSNLMNKADPRVDSDHDRSNNMSIQQTTNSSKSNVGPHSSKLANKADPRVDSDLDNSNNAGLNRTMGYGSAHVATGPPNSLDSDTPYGMAGGVSDGPHGNSMANKVNPNVEK